MVMFNLKEKKKEKIFNCNGEITGSCINSTDSITQIAEKVSQYLTDNNIEHFLYPFTPYIDIKTYNLNKLELKCHSMCAIEILST
jgi:hypothetical protein